MTSALRMVALAMMLASAGLVLWISLSLESWSVALAKIMAPVFGGAL